MHPTNHRRCAKFDTCIHYEPKACWYEIDGNSIGMECVTTNNLPCVTAYVKPTKYDVGDYVTILKTPYWVFKVTHVYPEGEDVFGVKRPKTMYRVFNTENLMLHSGTYIGSQLCHAEELSDKIDIKKWKGKAITESLP